MRSPRALVRDLRLDAVQVALRVVLRALSAVVPVTSRVVVSAFPQTEGNGVEIARALLRRYAGQVVWLQDGPEVEGDVQDLVDLGMVVVPKMSLQGLWHYLRAEAVFFTHGLYGSPRPRSRKPLINLWHGDGPKDVRPDGTLSALIPSTYLVGSTALFSAHQAQAFEVPPNRLLLTGNPRTDQLWHDVDARALRALGITGPFVVWMPTFRRTRAVGAVRSWSETGDETSTIDELGPLREGLARRGLQLVVKAHPMDADRRSTPGAVSVAESELVAAGVSLYELLGQSAGLVTDYSSVWVDYLLLDRPIAFWIPDRASYGRGLVPPDVLDWLPGESADLSVDPFRDFLTDLDAGGDVGRDLRRTVADRIGLHESRRSADDLLDALADRGAVRRWRESA